MFIICMWLGCVGVMHSNALPILYFPFLFFLAFFSLFLISGLGRIFFSLPICFDHRVVLIFFKRKIILLIKISNTSIEIYN